MGLKIPVSLVRFRVRAPLFRRTRLKGGFFAFGEPDSPSNVVRLFATSGSPCGPARKARCSTPSALVRVRAPLFRRTRLKGGFFAFGEPDSPSNSVRLFATSGSPCGPAQALFKNAPGVFVRVRAPLFRRTRLKGGFFAFGEPDSPSNCVQWLRKYLFFSRSNRAKEAQHSSTH